MKALCGLLECETCPCGKNAAAAPKRAASRLATHAQSPSAAKAAVVKTMARRFAAPCRLKEQLIAEFNALDIPDMEEVKSLNALLGAYVNLSYTLPSGQAIRFWDDNKVYLGNQLHKKAATAAMA